MYEKNLKKVDRTMQGMDLTYLLLWSKRTNDLEIMPASDFGAKCQ